MARAERSQGAAKSPKEANVTPNGPAPRSIVTWSAVAAIILIHLGLANAAAWNKCGTYDEASHIANAYSIWKTGDYRMFPIAIAQQRWMTLPLYLQDVPAPSTETWYWGHADNWTYGRELLYGIGNDGETLLRQVRFMTSLLSGVLALLVFTTARTLFGTAGGFVALLLYAFNPTVLAHAALATVDMSASLAIFAAMLTLWGVLQRLTAPRLILSGIVWGLAFGAKFSTLLLIPMGLILVAVRIFDGRPWDVRLLRWSSAVTTSRKFAYSALVIGVHIVAVWFVIWALFGFQFDTFREFPNDPKQIYTGSFEDVAARASRYASLLNFAREYKLLPEAYLYAFADTMNVTRARAAYLDGWYAIYGLRSFFPLAFIYKTPLAVFGVMLLGLAAHAARRLHQMRVEGRKPLGLLWDGIYAVLPLVVIIVVYGLTAVFSGMNIGIRHILPLFAPLFVLSGLAGEWLTAAVRRFRPTETANNTTLEAANAAVKSRANDIEPSPPAGWPSCPDGLLRAMCVAVIALSAFSVGTTLLAFPNYLAYFNLASGGTQRGYKHLVDSSLDWGQDLGALKEYLDQEGIVATPEKSVYLSYFGTTPPRTVGLKLATATEPGIKLLPSYTDRIALAPEIRQPMDLGLAPGSDTAQNTQRTATYCISATMLQSVYLHLETGLDDRQKLMLLRAKIRSGLQPEMLERLLNEPWNGPWTVRHEAMYGDVMNELNRANGLRLRDAALQAKENNPAARAPDGLAVQLADPIGGLYWRLIFAGVETLRMGRLCAYLRTREPIHVVNGSILIFSLNPDDIRIASGELPLPQPPRPMPEFYGQPELY